MKRISPPRFVVVFLILIGLSAYLYLDWHFNEPKVDHRTLAEKVKSCLGMDLTNLQNSLTLAPVAAGSGQFMLAFSLPLTIDAASDSYLPDGFGKFRLLHLQDNGAEANGYEISRQTNGTYLVKWNTLFAAYGPHALQVRFAFPTHGSYDTAEVFGSNLETTVTNILQWEYDGVGFGPKRTWFHGWLHESADYQIKIYNTNNTLVKIIYATNKTVIDEKWDYKPTDGQAQSAADFTAQVFVTPTVTNTSGLTNSNVPTVCIPYP